MDLIKQTKTSMDIFLSYLIRYNHTQKLILHSMKVWTPIEAKTSNLYEKSVTVASYLKTSSISRTKSQSLNVSCILAQLSSLNPLKPGVKLRMKM